MSTNTNTSTLDFQVETITPEVAAAYLARNDNNRHIRPTVVRRYALEMTQGNWNLTGDPIRFSKDNRLVDGQHRLLAIMKAQVPVMMAVLRGLDPDVQKDIDRGVGRNVTDVLEFEHGAFKYGRLAVSIARRVLAWDKDVEFSSVDRNSLIDFCNQNLPELVDASAHAMHILKDMGGYAPEWGAFFFRAAQVSPEALSLYLVDIKEVLPGDHSSPIGSLKIWALRKGQQGIKGYTSLQLIGAYVAAWNNWTKGQPMTKIYMERVTSDPIRKPNKADMARLSAMTNSRRVMQQMLQEEASLSLEEPS